MAEDFGYQHYQILKRTDGSLWELGRGAMGVTYKAYDTLLRCTVALKVINSVYLESDTARLRFLREARAAATLRHRNVASLLNIGTDGHGNYFLAMEFIDGETVDTAIKRIGHLDPAEALGIALQVSRALAAAAKKQLIHCDIKPSNLMLVDEDGEKIVKLIDFGLAKSARPEREDSGTLTCQDGFVGTPHFASPEQLEHREIDIRSDIYTLGATLYYMLTGRPPFSGSVAAVMSQHLYKSVPLEPLEGCPSQVITLIQSMMEKDREKRPQTPLELRQDIVNCLEQVKGPNASATLDLGFAPGEPLSLGAVIVPNYRLIEELGETPQGRKFLADDLRNECRVSLLVLSPEFLSDTMRFVALQQTVNHLRNAPHPMLRKIYSLETAADCTVLVEEHVVGPSLVDLLRTRSVLAAPEVVRLLTILAPLADHARSNRLEHVDLTLQGVRLTGRGLTERKIEFDLLRYPLTALEPLELKVNAIDFSFLPSSTDASGTGGWASSETMTHSASRGSYVRLLSLLAYELLGGPRERLDATGQYTPVAALTEEGNALLRRGLIDEGASAVKLAQQLASLVPGRRDWGRQEPNPPLLDENVQFTVYRPREIMPVRWYKMLIFTHLDERPEWLDANEPSPLEQVEDEAQRILGPRLETYRKTTDESLLAVPREGEIALVPEMQGIEFNPRTRSFSWKDGLCVHLETFELRARPDFVAPAVVRGRVTIFLGHLILAEVALSIRVSRGTAPAALTRVPAESSSARRFRRIFASYSHRDLEIVKEMERYSLSLGDRYLRDWVDLRAGELWDERLLGMITEADIFQLFWSWNSSQSPYVEREWRHALSLRREIFIRPTYWEVPMPDPPEPLRPIQFQRLEIANLPGTAVKGAAASASASAKPFTPQPLPLTPPPKGPAELPIKRKSKINAWGWLLGLGVIASLAIIGSFTIYRALYPLTVPHVVFGNLAVESDPTGAAITLDEGPPVKAPYTFKNVKFGSHRLTANLKGYLPIQQDLQFDATTPPKIVLKLNAY